MLNSLIYRLAKSLLFRMDPEAAHRLIVDGMGSAARIPGVKRTLSAVWGVRKTPDLAVDLFGLHFAHPIGLAAGLDKNAKAVAGFSRIGLSFLEVGTVTPVGQPGNERPRLFRLPADESLINRMGFNNEGAAAMAERLRRLGRRTVPLAVNIGKNKMTPNENAANDYRRCLQLLYPYGDFFVVNISSPNTPDLRALQHGDELNRLLAEVKEEMETQAERHGGLVKPILVKIAPDNTEEQLRYMADAIVRSGMSGIIATNTTVGRDGLTDPNARETGGLSGKPLAKRSTEVIRSLYAMTQGKLPIIGSGGIFSADDAYEKIRAGASLVEVYTALIYKGPGLLKVMHKGLRERLKKDGFSRISEAVGADHRD
ncbi:quinone-dependent dihydroorotate dehydrogenase [Cohnella pontilimi]|uniref:Dihydroorotate dehydrogenase (quinone) n=1 Tax=Cohnella pontilimi TaxID=2564100 RepID=A0A4U0F9D5_9BACL|nr:quinone-dependent dihydroorotate dehydrogenase [Cohnella pontilimi]TJY41373.1 quinone-dependent dihydroorotate dehydrogenase [Cohnella pontilimi]